MKIYLALLFLSLAGCGTNPFIQPMPYSPELHAKVVVLGLQIEGARGGPWQGDKLGAMACGQAFDAGRWSRATGPKYDPTCYLGEFSVPDGGTLGAGLLPVPGATSGSMWRMYDFERYWPQNSYPFNLKAQYNLGSVVEIRSDVPDCQRPREDGKCVTFVPPYRFGPFAANKCYLAWFEPTPVSPYRETKFRGQPYVAYELQPKSKEFECDIDRSTVDTKALSWYTL